MSETFLEESLKGTLAFVREVFPRIDNPWTPSLELKEELWAAVATLPSPRRKPVWSAISELDTILPPILRSRAARLLQCAYRCHQARWKRYRAHEKRFFDMALLLQRNIKVSWNSYMKRLLFQLL